MKLSDKLVGSKQPFFSLEFFPPKTQQGLINLYDRIERMRQLGPLFVAVTWGAGGSTSERTLELCAECQNTFGVDTLMHLTCTNMDVAKIDQALEQAKQRGIRSILALRGDAPRGQEYWTVCEGGFTHAVDLVKYIRAKYGDYFCLGVAGYPEAHTESESAERDLEYLKAKVEAGADFIVSQLFYDPELFLAWQGRCREAGIEAPILPGVLPIQSYQSLRRLIHLTKVKLPTKLQRELEQVAANDQAVKELGIQNAVEIIQALHERGVWGVHLTTLNLEHTVDQVLSQLSMARAPLRKQQSWDDFPNGRWGDARSPAFGTGMISYGSTTAHQQQNSRWQSPQSEQDVGRMFQQHVRGELQTLPWSDEPYLAPETGEIREELIRINGLGYWTLASQPALDGIASEDQRLGWGPRGGYVYQKAFIECFVSPARFPGFLSRLQSAGSRITYLAGNHQGDFMSNSAQATTLTWGVFPGRQLVESTQIDKVSFAAWRTEAFQVWADWAAERSESGDLLNQLKSGCWLVNVIDNQYKSPSFLSSLFI